MKLKTKLATLLVASATVLAVSSAGAATYTAGDLLLGFRASGGQGSTTDYIINLGSSTTFRGAAGGTSYGSYGTDLTATYGAGWAARSDLFWGVMTIREQYDADFGSIVNGDPSGTLYASFGTSVSLPAIDSGATNYLGMASNFGSLGASVNAANASFSSPAQIWSAQMAGAGSFGAALPEIESALSSSNNLAVNRFLSSTTGDTFGGTVGNPNLVNTLTINGATGAISIIPEPSTALLCPLAGLLLLRRRR